MPELVEQALKTPLARYVEKDGIEVEQRVEVAPLDDGGRFTTNAFMGLTVDQAHDFEDDYLRDVAKHGDGIASEEAWVDLSKGKTLAQLFEMWAWARTKDFGKLKLVPTFAQAEIIGHMMRTGAEDKGLYLLDLKARQLGASTGIACVFRILAGLVKDAGFLTMAHKKEKAEGLWAMQEECHQYMLFRPRVSGSKKSNRRKFTRSGSVASVESAEDKDPAHSSSYRFVHLSEYPRYPHPEMIDAAVGPTLPTIGHYAYIIEGTANGIGNAFYDKWTKAERGESGWVPMFHPWWKHPRYRLRLVEGDAEKLAPEKIGEEVAEMQRDFNLSLEQVKWYLHILCTEYDGDRDRMCENYPSRPIEAFLASGRPVFDMRSFERLLEMHAKGIDALFQGDIVEALAG